MRFVIITGGPLPEEASDVIRSFAGEADTKVIACDSGCDHLAKTGIVPDVVIGDMDSITKAGLDFIKANNIPRRDDLVNLVDKTSDLMPEASISID